MMNFVKLEKKQNYSLLFINRPDKLNALNVQVLDELAIALEEVSKDQAMRAIVITGAGDRVFVAGADIAAMNEMEPKNLDEFTDKGRQLFLRLTQSNLISIAALNGSALGGGLELALACDLRIAVDTAKLGLPEVCLGLVPAFGGTQFLPRLIGKALALEMILSGQKIDAKRAYDIGLINKVYPPLESVETFIEKVEEFVQKLLSNISMNAQVTTLRAIHQGLQVEDLPKALDIEKQLVGKLVQSLDYREGFSAFLEKREPKFLPSSVV